MDQIIFKYPNQKFVGIATRKTDGTLNHECYILVSVVPRKGASLFDRKVAEVLTGPKLLEERSRFACNPIEAVAVLSAKN
jgi:hypothetical protein